MWGARTRNKQSLLFTFFFLRKEKENHDGPFIMLWLENDSSEVSSLFPPNKKKKFPASFSEHLNFYKFLIIVLDDGHYKILRGGSRKAKSFKLNTLLWILKNH